jgi:predicted outer membrane repeat protein
VSDCVFSGCHATSDGGAIRAGADTTITNCTFSNNSAENAGSAINGPATICNSVFGQHDGAPIVGATSVEYSCLPITFAGTGNIAADPLFVNALGPDGVAGTEDDDVRLRADSPCIDAADTTALPADEFDLDGDGDTTEPLPLDAFGNCRVLETPAVPNTGIPSTNDSAVVDMGAHEYRRPADIAPDIGDGVVDVDDLIALILHWGPCDPPADPAIPPAACIADIDGNGEVAVSDLVAVILSWG